ncbi:MAG: MBOAT family protein [Oscillospiraceae bacterium]|nr:MBOAT family protein [Oscillospiraceae bacterium]
MLFSGIPFLFYFLPAVLIVYFFVPNRLKNGVLLASSLFFYAWGEPKNVLLMVLTIGAFYICGLGIGKSKKPVFKKVWLLLSLLAGLSLLGLFKYADFFIENLHALTGLNVPLLKLALPIGISFYTFQCISYTVDVYRGNVPAQESLIDFGTYVALFPQLIAGPIVRYVDVAKELKNRTTTWQMCADGLARFLVGLGKKVILANNLGQFVEVFRATQEPSTLFYWLYAIAFTLHIYFDFSGYSDMAIGLGKVFGFHFPENFNYPYLSGSVTEFWRRWHMTLGGWFRDYVYIPLGGNRVAKLRWVGNILLVWMLTGLWHGAAWNFVLWGLLYAAALLVEKWVPAIRKLPMLLRHGYVLLVVILGFVLFNGTDMTQVGQDLAGLFGMAGLPAVTGQTLYFLRSYAGLFLVGILASTPLPKRCWNRLGAARGILEPVGLLFLLLICTAYLVDGSFNPFLYFRF